MRSQEAMEEEGMVQIEVVMEVWAEVVEEVKEPELAATEVMADPGDQEWATSPVTEAMEVEEEE